MIDVQKTIVSQYAATSTIVQLIQNMNLYIDPRTDFESFYSFVWNVETAQGFGLDIWGRIVGIDRTVNVPADTPNPGMFAFTPGVYSMTDAEYRTVILAKALGNISNINAPSLNQLLTNMFEGSGRAYVLDMGSMTMRLTFEFWLEPWQYVVILNYGGVPRPAGVLMYIFQVDVDNTFGFYGTQLQPFNQGTFYRSV